MYFTFCWWKFYKNLFSNLSNKFYQHFLIYASFYNKTQKKPYRWHRDSFFSYLFIFRKSALFFVPSKWTVSHRKPMLCILIITWSKVNISGMIFVFSYLTDFSYFPLKKIQKVAGNDLNRWKIKGLKWGCRWFQVF